MSGNEALTVTVVRLILLSPKAYARPKVVGYLSDPTFSDPAIDLAGASSGGILHAGVGLRIRNCPESAVMKSEKWTSMGLLDTDIGQCEDLDKA